ncbi:hypothetical protein GCM10027169_07910 [Gordonia jinhuaensis]|uniref:Phosphotyrosine protein phosphatase I domain-containing protein n=2 Tax=Gordonia jinhuaensis TaxID=1517702 RepID=A0A916T082_9ACTN|nr:hypothetical protein GCM10011489_07510 [Gordonia jinhuaensis]
MAERMLNHQTDFVPAGVDAPVVASAGTGAMNGSAMHPLTEQALRERGIDTAGFASRMLTPAIVESADLVLCMTREHRKLAQQAVPVRWKRIFTLSEFVAGLEVGHGVSALDDESIRPRLDANSPEWDILDPMGQPLEAFESTAEKLWPLVESVARWVMSRPGDDAR